jgi:hypothetical protein
MALHRLTGLALVGALALGVSACGDDSPAPSPRTSSAAASPTPTATGPAAPVLPDLAARNDGVGAKAFVKFYFAALTYAMKTGDVELAASASGPKCAACRKMLDNIRSAYSDGGRITGGGWIVRRMQDVDDRTDGKHIFVFVVQEPQKYLDAGGGAVDHLERKKYAMELLVVWHAGWTIREVALL